MERPHGELRAGFANRLGGDNSHGLADLGQGPRGQITPVAHRADATLQFTSENGTHDHVFEAGVLEAFGSGFVHQRIADHQHLTAVGIQNILGGNASEDSLSKGFNNFTALDQGRDRNPAVCLAVMGQHNHILCNIHETAGQIARVGRLERRVREPFSRSVGRNEILQHAQAFAEIRGDRRFHDLTARLGHEAAHAGKLSNLLQATPRPGVRHGIDRIEIVPSAL